MEPDEIQRIYDSIHTYDIMRTTQDLSRVSTRDLLNECYRRRAIERFDYKVSADSYFLEEVKEARHHVKEDLIHGIWKSVAKNQAFADSALYITEEQDRAFMRVNMAGEIYICKHPKNLRK